MLNEKEKRALLHFKEAIVEHFSPQIAGLHLFGSKARGDDRKDSDIDVLVITREDDWHIKDEIGKIATQILIRDNIYLSVKVLGKPSLKRLLKLKSSFLNNIRREGIPL